MAARKVTRPKPTKSTRSNPVLAAVQALQGSVDTLQGSVDTLGDRVGSLEGTVGALDVKVEALDVKVEAQGKAIADLRENDRHQAERLAALSGTVATLADSIRLQGEESRRQREESQSRWEESERRWEESQRQRAELREIMHAQGVRFEQMQSHIATMLEGMIAGFARLDAKIDAVEARLSERIRVLEDVVRQNSADIRRIDQRLENLERDVASLRHDFEQWQGAEHQHEVERMNGLERRVAALEARVGVTS